MISELLIELLNCLFQGYNQNIEKKELPRYSLARTGATDFRFWRCSGYDSICANAMP